MMLGHTQYFPTLDLTSGYWQVPVREKDQEKTASGLFELNCMPFRINKAPSTFQQLTERCLVDYNFKTVLIYINYIIISSKTFEDHIQHLDFVFTCLAHNKLNFKHVKASTA